MLLPLGVVSRAVLRRVARRRRGCRTSIRNGRALSAHWPKNENERPFEPRTVERTRRRHEQRRRRRPRAVRFDREPVSGPPCRASATEHERGRPMPPEFVRSYFLLFLAFLLGAATNSSFPRSAAAIIFAAARGRAGGSAMPPLRATSPTGAFDLRNVFMVHGDGRSEVVRRGRACHIYRGWARCAFGYREKGGGSHTQLCKAVWSVCESLSVVCFSRQTRRKTPPPMSDHIAHEEWKRMRCTTTKDNRPRGT